MTAFVEPGAVCSCGSFILTGEPHHHVCIGCGDDCTPDRDYCGESCAAEARQWDAVDQAVDFEREREAL